MLHRPFSSLLLYIIFYFCLFFLCLLHFFEVVYYLYNSSYLSKYIYVCVHLLIFSLSPFGTSFVYILCTMVGAPLSLFALFQWTRVTKINSLVLFPSLYHAGLRNGLVGWTSKEMHMIQNGWASKRRMTYDLYVNFLAMKGIIYGLE